MIKNAAKSQELLEQKIKVKDYINPQLEDYKKYINDNKEQIAQKLVEKIKAVKILPNLPNCISDARTLVDFSICILGIDVQNRLHLLCSEKDVNKICRKIKFQKAG